MSVSRWVWPPSACIPWWVERVAKRMGDRVATSGIVSMPIGLEGTAAKVAATLECVASGAVEIDFLAAWSAILYGDLDAAIRDGGGGGRGGQV